MSRGNKLALVLARLWEVHREQQQVQEQREQVRGNLQQLVGWARSMVILVNCTFSTSLSSSTRLNGFHRNRQLVLAGMIRLETLATPTRAPARSRPHSTAQTTNFGSGTRLTPSAMNGGTPVARVGGNTGNVNGTGMNGRANGVSPLVYTAAASGSRSSGMGMR